MPDVERYLREGEREAYEKWQTAYPDGSMPAQVAERLADCRQILVEAAKFLKAMRTGMGYGSEELETAIAAQLAGVRGG